MSLRTETEALAVTLGLRVRSARQQRRWTAQDLAAKLDVSERTVRKVEKGETSVALGTVLAACVILSVEFGHEVDAQVARKRVVRPRASSLEAMDRLDLESAVLEPPATARQFAGIRPLEHQFNLFCLFPRGGT